MLLLHESDGYVSSLGTVEHVVSSQGIVGSPIQGGSGIKKKKGGGQ